MKSLLLVPLLLLLSCLHAEETVLRSKALPAALPGARIAKIGLNEWTAIAEEKGFLKE